MSEKDNKNLSEQEKDEAMDSAKKLLKKMGIPLFPQAEEIMNSFLNGDISKKDAMKKARNTNNKKKKKKKK